MRNPIDTESIARLFGQQYGVDIDVLKRDAAKLRGLINNAGQQPVDAIQIYNDCITCTPSNSDAAAIPDLETFEFSEIRGDASLGLARVEQNLDEAARYVENCLQVRRQYGEMAKLRNDTRFKFEEFVRLDLVHQDEVRAGLYELPLRDSEAERKALESGVTEATFQQEVVQKMLAEQPGQEKYHGVLSEDQVSKYIESTALIARHTANSEKETVSGESKKTTTYRTSVENATWLQTLSNAKGSADQQSERLSVAKLKEHYLRMDVAFRSQRAAISRQLAWSQIDEHCRETSILNFDKRLKNSARLFDGNLRNLLQRIDALKMGLIECYGLDIPLSNPKKGEILDEVAIWLIRVQDELSKHKRQQRSFIYSKAAELPLNMGKGTLDVELVIEEPSTRSLLRGAAFEFFGQLQRPISLIVRPPNGALTCDRKDGEAVTFGRVCPFSAGLDLKPQHGDLFWNGSAAGVWKIHGIFDQNAGAIDGVILHLWMTTT